MNNKILFPHRLVYTTNKNVSKNKKATHTRPEINPAFFVQSRQYASRKNRLGAGLPSNTKHSSDNDNDNEPQQQHTILSEKEKGTHQRHIPHASSPAFFRRKHMMKPKSQKQQHPTTAVTSATTTLHSLIFTSSGRSKRRPKTSPQTCLRSLRAY